MRFGSVIFGDNQFLGVNHSDQSKATVLDKSYQRVDAIIATIAVAYDSGIRDFMFTVHDRYFDLFDEIRRSRLFPEMFYTPCVPYAHKYWNMLSSGGPATLLGNTLGRIDLLKLVPATIAQLAGKPTSLTELLCSVELLMCKGLPLRGVFLLNLAFDFLVAIEAYKYIESFEIVVRDRFGLTPGFFTMNHPHATSVLCDRIGLEKPWLCANFNSAGFRMNPSQIEVEKSFAVGKTNNIAMSVFTGSRDPAIALDYAIDHLNSGHLNSILFGSSNPINIKINADTIFSQSGS